MSLPPAVILAAGESSRFWPLSTHGHKSLHRLCGRPIIEHSLRSFAAAGGTEAVIVQSPHALLNEFEYRTIEESLGDGSELGLTLTYVNMERPTGARDAIMLARDQLAGEFLAINPENLNAGELAAELVAVRDGAAAVVAAQVRHDTWQFGVFEEQAGRLTGYVEKPAAVTEPSQLCNMSVQLLGQDYLELLAAEPAGDPEANLRALLRLADQAEVRISETTLPFFPLKYPWHLFAMAEHLQPPGAAYLDPRATVADGATVDPGCVIEADAVVETGAVLKSCLVGAGCRLGPVTLSDSILGAGTTLGPGVVVEETPLDGGKVFVDVKGDYIDTDLDALGTVTGQGASLSAGARIAPGVMVGSGASIGGARRVNRNVPDLGQSGIEPGPAK